MHVRLRGRNEAEYGKALAGLQPARAWVARRAWTEPLLLEFTNS